MSGKPQKAPEAKPARPAASALPDAALVDDDAEVIVAPVHTGIAAWMPHSIRGWAIAGSVAFSLVIIMTAAIVTLIRAPAQASPSTVALTGKAIVIDGATISIANRKLVLEGIEAPPADLICRDRAWKYRCGDDSRRALE